MKMNKQDLVTVPVAAGAIAWPNIHGVVEFAAREAQLMLPLLGALWLVVQIVAKIHSTWIKPRR
ncbi:hypothetical protein OA90_25555 [Labrenzia sp. OB1]|nr:hypothetical protein OA90_25555 [Labrenzia sp. OB1]